jgi:hypothetical protein
MKTSRRNTTAEQRTGEYALGRGLGIWEVTFSRSAGQIQGRAGHGVCQLAVAASPPQPIHAAAPLSEAGPTEKNVPGSVEVFQQRSLGLDVRRYFAVGRPRTPTSAAPA